MNNLRGATAKERKWKIHQRGDVDPIPEEIFNYVVETTFLNKGTTEAQKQDVEK